MTTHRQIRTRSVGSGAKPAQRPSKVCYTDAKKFQALNYQRIARSLGQIKGCLADGFPFVLGFTVYAGFVSDEVARTGVLNLPAPANQARTKMEVRQGTPSWQWDMMILRNGLLFGTPGVKHGGSRGISQCLTPICLMKTFQMTFGPFA